MTKWTMTIVHEVNVVIMLNMILLKIPPDVIGLDKKNNAMPFANSNTITDDVTLTLPHIAFEILCPCTKFHSHTAL